jgi:hypothetical protein
MIRRTTYPPCYVAVSMPTLYLYVINRLFHGGFQRNLCFFISFIFYIVIIIIIYYVLTSYIHRLYIYLLHRYFDTLIRYKSIIHYGGEGTVLVTS